MTGRKTFPDPFDHERHIAYLRWRCQATYRGEDVELTLAEWFAIWSTPELWARRGRRVDDICLIRKDIHAPWRRGNLALIDRRTQLTMSNRRNYKIPVDNLYEKAIWRDYE
jgi:hypothetical protein